MSGITSMGMPVVFALIIFIVEGVLLLTLSLGVSFVGVNQFFTQVICKFTKRDMLITVAGNEMWIEAGNKENKTDVIYKKDHKKGVLNHIDPIRYMPNSSIKWGKSKVLAYYASKAWPKTIRQLAATERVWQIASIRISKDGKIPNEMLSIAGHKLQHTRKIKEILDHLGITAEYYQADPNQVLKYNEYLCLIAESDKNKALELIKMYADLELPNESERKEAEEKLKATAEQYIVLPDTVDKKTLTPDKIQEIRNQLIEEIRMVREFCKDLLVPPTVVALNEFMQAFPDKSLTDIILNDIQSTCEQKAAANQPKNMDMKWVAAIVVGEASVFLVIILLILTLVK
jgi:hypothetical protein